MVTVPPLPRSFEEAAQRHAAVEAELERVCGSVHFRTSKRSCEFLRYVVRVTLDGRTDSLKERSIGIDLLGRDASYDPSSDATVRVRANEVRKRLVSYYGSAAAVGVRILLPTGSYVPQFSPAVAAPRINPLDPLAERSAAPRRRGIEKGGNSRPERDRADAPRAVCAADLRSAAAPPVGEPCGLSPLLGPYSGRT